MLKILCHYCHKQLTIDDPACPSCGTLKVDEDEMVLTSRGKISEKEMIAAQAPPDDGAQNDLEKTACVCKYCGKGYKTKGGRDRHEEGCSKK